MTNTNRTVQLKIYRYDPDQDAKPYMQDISVELESTDRKLLDAMVKLKAQDDSISFRRSCREGVCGSDAMNINGKNGPACSPPTASSPTRATRRPTSGWTISKTPIACSVATPS